MSNKQGCTTLTLRLITYPCLLVYVDKKQVNEDIRSTVVLVWEFDNYLV